MAMVIMMATRTMMALLLMAALIGVMRGSRGAPPPMAGGRANFAVARRKAGGLHPRHGGRKGNVHPRRASPRSVILMQILGFEQLTAASATSISI
jgi:hypothetical protein